MSASVHTHIGDGSEQTGCYLGAKQSRVCGLPSRQVQSVNETCGNCGATVSGNVYSCSEGHTTSTVSHNGPCNQSGTYAYSLDESYEISTLSDDTYYCTYSLGYGYANTCGMASGSMYYNDGTAASKVCNKVVTKLQPAK